MSTLRSLYCTYYRYYDDDQGYNEVHDGDDDDDDDDDDSDEVDDNDETFDSDFDMSLNQLSQYKFRALLSTL